MLPTSIRWLINSHISSCKLLDYLNHIPIAHCFGFYVSADKEEAIPTFFLVKYSGFFVLPLLEHFAINPSPSKKQYYREV